MLRPALFLVGVTLSACGSDTKTTTIKGENGETVTVETASEGDGFTRLEATDENGEKISANIGGTGATWPTDAPAYAPAYPGATINSVITSNSDGKTGSMIAFVTSDPPLKVIDHYKALAAKSGLGNVSTMTANTMNMFSAGDSEAGEFVVQASPTDGKTTALITYSNKIG